MLFIRKNPPGLLHLLLICGISHSQCLAASQEKGKVSMQGAIIDTACSIATGDRDQSINLGTLPVSVIASTGKGPAHTFTIQLTDCVLERSNPQLPDWKKFQVTFDGENSGSLFSLQGKASGVGLRISDLSGKIATAGQALPAQPVSTDDMQLNFTLMLVRNHQPLTAGNYSTALRFKLDYF